MKPRLFVELCARTAAVSLALQGGPRCKPPVSGPGCKTGYVRPILDAAGAAPGIVSGGRSSVYTRETGWRKGAR